MGFETSYVNGKQHGTQNNYYESGVLHWEAHFVNGKEHGIEKEYYTSGKLQREIIYENGKKHGIEKRYYESGNLEKEIYYESGKEIKVSAFKKKQFIHMTRSNTAISPHKSVAKRNFKRK
jgi:antitoxin component YwqK of YwqJK toxin-antitoxin module